MYDYIGIYEAIIEATQSELILFFIIIALVIAAVIAPLFIATLKDRKAQREHDILREENQKTHIRESQQQLIDVIKENSSVLASLNAVLKNNGANYEKALDRVHERLNESNSKTDGVISGITEITAKVNAMMDANKETASKLNRVFITMCGGKAPPLSDSEEEE